MEGLFGSGPAANESEQRTDGVRLRFEEEGCENIRVEQVRRCEFVDVLPEEQSEARTLRFAEYGTRFLHPIRLRIEKTFLQREIFLGKRVLRWRREPGQARPE